MISCTEGNLLIKVSFDLDLKVRDLRSSILGKRVSNIYDLNDKAYLFKFTTPGVAEKVLYFSEYRYGLDLISIFSDRIFDGKWYKVSYYEVFSSQK